MRAIKIATKAANEQINAFALAHPEFRGMGTTATIAGVLGDTLYLAQVGDSRAYLVRDGVARQITKDQSLMQKLIEAGELTEEEAEQSERRNIILQALGPEPTIKVDLTHQVVRRGDTLVLCSDGLSGQVTKDEIAAIVTEETDLTIACKRLIDRANENGGPDNITVIVARFDGSGSARRRRRTTRSGIACSRCRKPARRRRCRSIACSTRNRRRDPMPVVSRPRPTKPTRSAARRIARSSTGEAEVPTCRRRGAARAASSRWCCSRARRRRGVVRRAPTARARRRLDEHAAPGP